LGGFADNHEGDKPMSLGVGFPMAKKKPRPEESGPRQTILNIKGRLAWKEWLERLAKHNRETTSAAVDHALAMYAKATGFTEPPPER
jgi:hypothetical protein